MNSSVRLGVSPATSIPTDFFSQRFWGLLFLCWNSGLCNLSCPPVVPPDLFAHKCGIAHSASCHLTWSPGLPGSAHPCHPAAALLWVPSTWLPVSAPPTGLDECFLFNSLVVRLPYGLIFWRFWLFLFLKLLSFFWLCEEAQRIYLFFHLGQKSIFSQFWSLGSPRSRCQLIWFLKRSLFLPWWQLLFHSVLTWWRESELSGVSFYHIRSPVLWNQSPILMTSFNLNCFHKDSAELTMPISKYSHTGDRASTYKCWGYTVESILLSSYPLLKWSTLVRKHHRKYTILF